MLAPVLTAPAVCCVHILEALACADFILDSITQADRIGPPSCCQERGVEIGFRERRREAGGWRRERETSRVGESEKLKEREGKERKGKERKGVQQEREEAGRHE